MSFDYSSYSRQAIKQAPQTLWFGERRIDLLAFSTEDNAHKPPLLVVGGAFQNFVSYKYCVERIYEDFPVVLIDLPSLGNNDQVAPDMGMESLADLLHQLVDHANCPQVHLMGLSLGSAVAAAFAYKYPQRTGKLITAGIVVSPRQSWRMLIDESVRVLDQARMEPFSQAVVLYLVNYLRLKETGMTPTARKMFCRQMKRLNDNERERYKINGLRLSTTDGLLGFPECDTLVTTGEYDSFTLPHENAAFARGCPNGRFVLINNADHLPQLQQREVSLELFSSFLNERPLEAVEGTRVFSDADIDNMEMRRDKRLRPANPVAQLVTEEDSDNPLTLDVEVVDISFFGCLLDIKSADLDRELHQRDCALQMQQLEMELGVLIFDEDKQGRLRCLFKHGNIKQTEAFREQLANHELFVE